MLENGLEYQILNSYRSAILAHHSNGDPVVNGKHPLVTILMKLISTLRPPRPRYNFIWDVEQVLNHLKTYVPNSETSVKLLSLKPSILLALTATQMGSEIRNLDIKFMMKTENKYIFLPKQSLIYQNMTKDIQAYFFTLFQIIKTYVSKDFRLLFENVLANKGETLSILSYFCRTPQTSIVLFFS